MGLIGDWIVGQVQRGRQANQDRALLESLASYGQDNGQGNSTPNAAAVPASGPEADMVPTGGGGGGGFDPSAVGNSVPTAVQNYGAPTPTRDTGNDASYAAQRGAQADAIRRVIQAYNPGAKDLHTAVKGLGVDQLEGILRAYSIRSAMDQQAARMQDYEAQAMMRRQNAIDDQTAGQFVNNFMQAPDQQVGDPEMGEGTRPPTMQERWNFAAKSTPGFGGRVVPKVVEALTKYGQMADSAAGGVAKPVIGEGPFPGTRIVQVPGTKEWKLVSDPSGQALQPAINPETGEQIPGLFQLGNKPVQVPQPKARPVPESFHKAMDQVSSDYADALGTMQKPDSEFLDSTTGNPLSAAKIKARRTAAAGMLKAAQAKGQALADRYHAAGDIPDEMYQQVYQGLGLAAPMGAPGAAGTPGGSAGKVMVQDKKGNKYWLPKGQLPAAKAQGYTLVQ